MQSQVRTAAKNGRPVPAKEILRRSASSHFSSKQSAALLAAASGKNTSRAKSSRKVSQPSETLKQTVQTAVRREVKREMISRPLVSRAQQVELLRQSPSYAEAWRLHGMPTHWPLPYPVFNGQNEHRFVYSHGGTVTTTMSVPAGYYGVIYTSPSDLTYGAIGYTGSSLATLTLTKTSVMKDTAAASTDLFGGTIGGGGASWGNAQAPWSLMMDSGSVKSGATFKVPGTTQPPIIQCIGSELEAEVLVPYDGMCVATVVSPYFTQGARLRATDILHFDSAGVGSSFGLSREFHGHVQAPPVITATTTDVQTTSNNLGEVFPCVGATESATRVFHIPCLPDDCFHFGGYLDATDAAANSSTCADNNFYPRNGLNNFRRGCLFIYNSGSTAITAIYRAKAVFAQVMQGVDSASSVPALSESFRHVAQTLKRVPAPTGPEKSVLSSVTGSSHAEAIKNRIKLLANLGSKDPNAVVRSMPSASNARVTVGSTLHDATVGATAVATASAAPSIWSRVTSGLRTMGSEVEGFVSKLGPSTMEVVEEGAPMLIAAA